MERRMSKFHLIDRYVRDLADDPLREATAKIGAVITGNGTGEVVPIKRRRP
jgi:hypothetical protein